MDSGKKRGKGNRRCPHVGIRKNTGLENPHTSPDSPTYYLALDKLFKSLVFELRHRYPWGISDEQKNTKLLAYLYSANFPQRFDAGYRERAFTKVGRERE